jgi:hypothetical protein
MDWTSILNIIDLMFIWDNVLTRVLKNLEISFLVEINCFLIF